MTRRGFTVIEMIIVVAIIGIIALIGFPKISKTLDKTNVRSARDAVGTLAGTARPAAIQRGCRSVLHLTGNTVWVTTACPTTVDTISGVQDLYALFKVTMSASRDSVQYDPRGLSMDAFPSNTVARLTGRVTTRSEEHTSELQSPCNLVCRLLLEKKNRKFSRSPSGT